MAIAIGNGATLMVKSTVMTSANGTNVASVVSVSFDGLKVTTVESTVLSSGYKTFLPGIIDGGTITVTCNSDTADTGQSLLTTNMLAKTLTYFILTFADGSVIGGTTGDTAYIESYKTDAAVDSMQTASWTLRTTGTLQVA